MSYEEYNQSAFQLKLITEPSSLVVLSHDLKKLLYCVL